MATKYPASIDNNSTLPPIVDGRPVSGTSVEILRKAIIAIESELGVKPGATYATVRARLDALEANISGLQPIQLNQDLDGTLTSQTVIGIQGRPVSSAAPVYGQFLGWNGLAWVPADVVPDVTYAGDLSGNLTSQQVVGLQTRPLASTAPLIGQVVGWDGYTWLPISKTDANVFIFRPGGTPSGNVFTTWTSLMAERDLHDGPSTIVVDDSLASAAVDPGVWDLTRDTKIVGYKYGVDDGYDTAVNFNILNGAQLLNPSEFDNLSIIGYGQTFPSINVSPSLGYPHFIVRNVNFYQDSTATHNVIRADGGTIQFYGTSRLVQDSNPGQILGNFSVGDLPCNLELYDLSAIDNNTLDGYFNITTNGGSSFNDTQAAANYALVKQNNPIQTQSYLSLGVANPNLVVARPVDYLSPTDETKIGAINFSSDTNGYPGVIGNYSAILSGVNSYIQSDYGVIAGGSYNAIASSSNNSTIGGGFNHLIVGEDSTISGGFQNSIDGYASTVSGGVSNLVIGSSCVLAGGNDNTIEALGTVISGGANNSNAGKYAFTSGGKDGYAFRYGQSNHAAGKFSVQGDAQSGRYFVKGTSTNGSTETLMDPDGYQFRLENGKSYAIRAVCLANRTDGFDRAMFIRTILAYGSGGSATISNTDTTLNVANGTTWSFVFTTSGNSIVATFTGTAGQTVRGMVTYEWSEVGGGP